MHPISNRYKNKQTWFCNKNEIVLQPASVVVLFFPRAKDAAEAVADDDAAADKGTANTATKQTLESEDAAADEDTAAANTATKQTFESEDAAADEDTANTATKQTCESEDAAADEDTANIATKQTFRSMGLRCKNSVAIHLLLENAYESNLLSDISKVDYLAGNLGRTNLRPLEGLPPFVDDIFVFGYLSREECVFQKGKLSCTSGEKGTAKVVVASIANALERAVGKRGYMQTSLVHTVAAGDTRSSTIRATIARIEKDTLYKANRKWKEIHPQKEIAGYFVAKCDVSEVPLEELHSGLHVFEKCLVGYGYGIYSIDYTQDFSGVLDRQALVDNLGFRRARDFCTAIDEKEPTILENTNNVEEHICTWISTTAEGRTARTKIYNKVVSNFEAGEIREPVGGHLADFADCPNPLLRQTFLHPDVEARGCTRIEVSLYACPQNKLSSKKATDCIEKVLEQVSNEDEEYGLFVVQPPSKQWQHLAESLDRCLVLADRLQGHIFVAWYAHTGTGRISGIHVHPTPAKVRDEAKWEKAILWAAGDFGFQNCPIFRIDILSADEEGVELGPLRCYTKDENARTILAACKNPTQLHPNGGDPSTLLPPTDKIVWEWRDKKCHAIGNDSSKYKLQEIQEIAEQRKISAVSTRKREKVLAELRYSRGVETREMAKRRKTAKKRGGSGKGSRSGNCQPAKVRRDEEKNRSKKQGDSCNSGWHSIWGETKSCRIASRQKVGCPRFSRQRRQSPGCIAAWKRSGSCCLGDKRFAKNPTRVCGLLPFGRERQLWSAAFLASVCLWFRKTWRVGVAHRTFEKFPKRARKNHRVEPHPSGNRTRLAFLQDLGSKCEEYETLRGELAKNCLQKICAPANKTTKKTTDLPQGEYICKRFATTTFRNALRTILFLLPLGEDGEQATDEETPTHVVFLEKEIAAMGGIEALEKRKNPLRCLLGEEKTTPSKRKCRRVALS